MDPKPVDITRSSTVPGRYAPKPMGVSIESFRNYSGQVKANYSTLSLTGFTADVNQAYAIGSGTATLSAPPTTTWPYPGNQNYNPDFYDVTAGRLKENPIQGQSHLWRIDGVYSGKAAGNNGAFVIEIHNPDSGFMNTQVITLPSSATTGEWTVNLLTIADNASIPAGLGYILRSRTSFTDANISFTIQSITRVSMATEVVL